MHRLANFYLLVIFFFSFCFYRTFKANFGDLSEIYSPTASYPITVRSCNIVVHYLQFCTQVYSTYFIIVSTAKKNTFSTVSVIKYTCLSFFQTVGQLKCHEKCVVETLSHVVSTHLFCLSKNKLGPRAQKFQVFSLSHILCVGSIDICSG